MTLSAKQRAEQKADLIEALSERIQPILHGHDPMVQGAVLADLLAMWLAGHFAGADKEENADLRSKLLADHLTLVAALIPECEAQLLEHTKKGAS